MAYTTTAGTVLSVSTDLPATFDEAGYEALTWSVVGEITTIPTFGAEANMGAHNPIGDRYTKKYKGSINAGSQTIEMALDDDDAGQIILQDHAEGAAIDDDVAVMLEYPNGQVRYYTAQVGSFQETPGGVDDYLTASAMFDITRPVVKVAPTP